MNNFTSFVNTFVTEDYFLIFLIFMIILFIILVVILIKTRKDYYEETRQNSYNLKNDIFNDIANETFESISENNDSEDYFDKINAMELSDEEEAVISADELERRRQEKIESMGAYDNEALIQKYEEEQEKKAIISYEQLLKNASNISLSYSKEEKEDKEAPAINKVNISVKEVSETQNYSEEEEFLRLLKEYKNSLPY